MIKQILEKNEVQTGLMVDVDGVRVSYCRVPNRFAYKFFVTVEKYQSSDSVLNAKLAIMELVSKLESQSYDHGSEWRRTEIEEDSTGIERYGEFEMCVYFRIKDIY